MSNNPVDIVNALGAIWAPDFDQYVNTGDVSALTCVLCQHSPCDCPPFGSDAYFDLVNKRHNA